MRSLTVVPITWFRAAQEAGQGAHRRRQQRGGRSERGRGGLRGRRRSERIGLVRAHRLHHALVHQAHLAQQPRVVPQLLACAKGLKGFGLKV